MQSKENIQKFLKINCLHSRRNSLCAEREAEKYLEANFMVFSTHFPSPFLEERTFAFIASRKACFFCEMAPRVRRKSFFLIIDIFKYLSYFHSLSAAYATAILTKEQEEANVIQIMRRR